jgi:hypothetical protein
MQNESNFDKRAALKISELKPLLSDEFLKTLAEAAKVCGWEVDHIETEHFVFWCFDVAGKDKPEVSAYDYKHADLKESYEPCLHPDSICVYESEDGEFERRICQDCSARFRVEIAQ